MSVRNRRKAAALLVTLIGTLFVTNAGAQNHAPNPYETIEGWARIPAGREWGATSAIYPAKVGPRAVKKYVKK